MGVAEARVVPADGRRLLKRFIDLPYEIYRDHPWWIPPLRRDERARFDPQRNPFFDHGTLEPFLALRGDRVVGRIAAIRDRLYDEAHGPGTAFFGFFEAEDAGAAAALLGAVERWAGDRGCRRLRGPLNPTLHDPAGLLVEGFEHPRVLMMPWNPSRYRAYLEDAGYGKVKDLLAWEIDVEAELGPRLHRIAERQRRRAGVEVRQLDPRHFDRDARKAFEIYREAWKDNWGFVPPTDREIDHFVARLKPVTRPDSLIFVEVDGEPVGFWLCLPDFNQLLAGTDGRLSPRLLFRFLFGRGRLTRARLLLMGVLPRHRGAGLVSLLVQEFFPVARARGFSWVELSWTLEDNRLVNRVIVASGGRHYRTYRIFEKSSSN